VRKGRDEVSNVSEAIKERLEKCDTAKARLCDAMCADCPNVATPYFGPFSSCSKCRCVLPYRIKGHPSQVDGLCDKCRESSTVATFSLPEHFRNVVERAKELRRAEVLCGFETGNGKADLTMQNLLDAAHAIESLEGHVDLLEAATVRGELLSELERSQAENERLRGIITRLREVTYGDVPLDKFYSDVMAVLKDA
jgi:hypothetical protein